MARTRRRQPVDYPESYLFEIETTEPHYSISTTDPRRDAELYREYWHYGLIGTCRAPRKTSGRTTRLVFIADRGLFDRPKSLDRDWRPLGVGHLTMRGDRSDYLGSLPYDAVWGIASGVAAGVFKYVVLTGPRLKYGSCSVSGASFVASYDPDDFWDPADQPGRSG